MVAEGRDGGRDGLQRGTRKLLGVMDMIIILTVVMVPWEHPYVKLIELSTLNMLDLLYVSYIYRKLFLITVVALRLSRTLRGRGMGWVRLGQVGPAGKQGERAGGGQRSQSPPPPGLMCPVWKLRPALPAPSCS